MILSAVSPAPPVAGRSGLTSDVEPATDRGILNLLREMATELTEFGNREERQFLLIGERLADFHKQAKEVSDHSQAAIDCLMKDEAGGALDDLRSLLDGLADHIEQDIKEARHNEESLSRLIAHLERIDQPLQSLAKVVKVLLALSFSTRVESTHGQRGQILQVLADNLKELAAKIHDKTEKVRDRLRSMSELAVTARDRMRYLHGESLVRARSIIQQSGVLFDVVSNRRKQSLADASLLNSHSRNVSEAISEVVSSIQFHDITRQQVEHVRATLEEICTGGGISRTSILDVCRLQSAQLRHTRGDLVSAVARIIKNLHEVSRSVGQIVHQTRIVSGLAADEETTFFKEIEPIIASVTAILEQSNADNRLALVAVDDVLHAMEDLNRLLVEIELIGTEMKLIAFNAGITAAHNMERGAGLGVIADSIQTLSGQVLSRTQEFAAGYHQMNRLVQTLADERSPSFGETGQDGGASMNERALALVDRLREMNHSLVAMLRTMDAAASSLAEDILLTADSITIHVDAGRVIDDLLGSMDDVAEVCQSGIGAAETSDGTMLERLSGRYTMQSEREVHRRTSRLETPPAGAGHVAAAPGKVKAKGREFGENVELF